MTHRAVVVLAIVSCLATGCERPEWNATTGRTLDPFDVREGEPKVLTVDLELGGSGRPGDFRYETSQLQLGGSLTHFIETCADPETCEARVSWTWSGTEAAGFLDAPVVPVPAGEVGSMSSRVPEPFVECRRRDPCPQTLEARFEVTGPGLIEVAPSLTLSVDGFGRRALLVSADLLLDAEVSDAP